MSEDIKRIRNNRSAAELIIEVIETGEPIIVEDDAPIGTQLHEKLTPEDAKDAIRNKIPDTADARSVATLFGETIEE